MQLPLGFKAHSQDKSRLQCKPREGCWQDGQIRARLALPRWELLSSAWQSDCPSTWPVPCNEPCVASLR